MICKILNYHEKSNESHYAKWSNWHANYDDKANENVSNNEDEIDKILRKMLRGSHGWKEEYL